jgi:hypothetical protein
MDGTHFDSLTRRLSTSSTRRRFWLAVGGGTLGLAFAQVGPVQARDLPRCFGKKTGERCSGRTFCCGGNVCDYANAQHYYETTEKRCCKPTGAPCQKHRDCCGLDVLCDGGYCVMA